MIVSHETLTNPMFWIGYLCSSFGQVGEPFELGEVVEVFGVAERRAVRWWHDFTGWYEGIFEKSDGEVADPSTLTLEFRRGVKLSIEFHAGDTYYRLNAPDDLPELVGNVGPHWILPALRWPEAVALARGAAADSPPQSLGQTALLLLLPCAWLTEGDDLGRAGDLVKKTWLASNLVGSREAGILTRAWARAVDVRNDYRWWPNGEAGWVTDAEWSVRHVKKPLADVKRINRLLLLAADA